MRVFVPAFVLSSLVAGGAFAQGQDSLRSERDFAVIAELLAGHYDNYNQSYFEYRLDDAEELRHPRIGVTVQRESLGETATFAISVSGAADTTAEYKGELSVRRDRDLVLLRLSGIVPDGGTDPATCLYVWRRSAAEFHARRAGACGPGLPGELKLSDGQLWVYPGPDSEIAANNPFVLHRTRPFQCYVDIPGVGGGRDEPYERYDGIRLHDRGGSHWFDTRESPSRRLGVTLYVVDWPINNYEGIFTRDSLVIYVSEQVDGERREHGYAFTEPDATRIGVNLKWLLATCFMVSNADATPSL